MVADAMPMVWGAKTRAKVHWPSLPRVMVEQVSFAIWKAAVGLTRILRGPVSAAPLLVTVKGIDEEIPTSKFLKSTVDGDMVNVGVPFDAVPLNVNWAAGPWAGPTEPLVCMPPVTSGLKVKATVQVSPWLRNAPLQRS